MNSARKGKGRFVPTINTTRTFAYLHHAADWALHPDQPPGKDGVFRGILSMMATAACIEAYLNHIGPELFGADKWDTCDAGLRSPKEKLKATLRKVCIPAESVRQEYNASMLCIDMRNDLAHGRTHDQSGGGTIRTASGNRVSSEPPRWLRSCTLEKAQRTLDGVTRLMASISEKVGGSKMPWFILGNGSGWIDYSKDAD